MIYGFGHKKANRFMKTTLLPRTALSLITLFVSSNVIAQAQLPFRPLYDAPTNAEEQQQLNSLFSQARAASANVTSGPSVGFQRRQYQFGVDARCAPLAGAQCATALRVFAGDGSLLAGVDNGQRFDERCRRTDGASSGRRPRKTSGIDGQNHGVRCPRSRVHPIRQKTGGRRMGLGGGNSGLGAQTSDGCVQVRVAFSGSTRALDAIGSIPTEGHRRNGIFPQWLHGGRSGSNREPSWLAHSCRVVEQPYQRPVPCVIHLRSEHFVVVRERRGDFTMSMTRRRLVQGG